MTIPKGIIKGAIVGFVLLIVWLLIIFLSLTVRIPPVYYIFAIPLFYYLELLSQLGPFPIAILICLLTFIGVGSAVGYIINKKFPSGITKKQFFLIFFGIIILLFLFTFSAYYYFEKIIGNDCISDDNCVLRDSCAGGNTCESKRYVPYPCDPFVVHELLLKYRNQKCVCTNGKCTTAFMTASECEELLNIKEKDFCLLDTAKRTDNSTLCEKISDEKLKNLCKEYGFTKNE